MEVRIFHCFSLLCIHKLCRGCKTYRISLAEKPKSLCTQVKGVASITEEEGKRIQLCGIIMFLSSIELQAA